MGRRFFHDVTDSTSLRAFASIEAGEARDRDVHSAREQTAGHGRFGRRWHSARDEGLYLSLVLLGGVDWNPAVLTMATGLAVLDAARELGLLEARLKWPNDLVVADRKLAGVLVETRSAAHASPHYVVGIGVNVRQRAFPPELEHERPVTSLAMLGIDGSVEAVGELVLEALERRIGQAAHTSEGISADFLTALGLANQRVRVSAGDQRLEGVLAGLSVSEGVLIRNEKSAVSVIPLEHVRELIES